MGMSADPQTMFKLGMGLDIAGGIFGAYEQYQQGATTQDYYNFQARQIERRGGLEAKRVRENVAGFEASQRAALAAGGISADSVSARDILEDTAKKGALDELLIRHNANVEAWNARYQGKMAKAAGMTGAATTLLGTAGQAADKWARWKKTGAGVSGPAPSVSKQTPFVSDQRYYIGWA